MPTDDTILVPYGVFAPRSVDLAYVTELANALCTVLSVHTRPNLDSDQLGEATLYAIAGVLGHVLTDQSREVLPKVIEVLSQTIVCCYNKNQELKLRGGSHVSTSYN